MRKAVYCSAAFVAMAACLAWAGGDVWKIKPYQQWDQKDVQQVLNDSPWATMHDVPAPWRSAANSGGSHGGSGSRSTGDQRIGGASPMVLAGDQGAPSTSFMVRWNSAQTVREAIARNALLNNKIAEAEAAKFVAQEPATYEIFVDGADMSPFASETEADLKAKAYLDAKQSKQKIEPSGVAIQRSPDNKKVVFLAFSFPRQIAANQPLITAKDKSVEFGCKLKDLDLRARFDLHKMVNEKGPDL